MKQIELNAIPRKRVQLIADAPDAEAGVAEAVASIVAATNSVALAGLNQVARQERRRAVVDIEPRTNMKVDVEAFFGYSDWMTGAPPCTGFWDAQLSGPGAGVDEQRLWFDAKGQQWRTEAGSWLSVAALPDLKYRGLAQPWHEGYIYEVPGLVRRRERVALED